VKTKVLMLSATPVNNRFNDAQPAGTGLRRRFGKPQQKLRTSKTVEEVFRNAQASFNAWAKLPIEERTARAILDSLDFDFFELLDSVTIARSQAHSDVLRHQGHRPIPRAPQTLVVPFAAHAAN
jgi:hypothetical protein